MAKKKKYTVEEYRQIGQVQKETYKQADERAKVSSAPTQATGNSGIATGAAYRSRQSAVDSGRLKASEAPDYFANRNSRLQEAASVKSKNARAGREMNKATRGLSGARVSAGTYQRTQDRTSMDIVRNAAGGAAKIKEQTGAGRLQKWMDADGNMQFGYKQDHSTASAGKQLARNQMDNGFVRGDRATRVTQRAVERDMLTRKRPGTGARVEQIQESEHTAKVIDGDMTYYYDLRDPDNPKTTTEEQYNQLIQLDAGYDPAAMTAMNRFKFNAEEAGKDMINSAKMTGQVMMENAWDRYRDDETIKDWEKFDQYREEGKQETIAREKPLLEEKQQIQQRMEAIKAGASDPMKFLLDVEATTEQQIPGFMLGAVTGGYGFMLPMAVQSYGSEYANARLNGATENEARISAALNAGTEILSEFMFSGGRTLGRLTGVQRGLVPSLLKTEVKEDTLRLIKSSAGRDLLTVMKMLGKDASEEGLEEVVAGVVQPVISEAIYGDPSNLGSREWWETTGKEAIYAGLLGATLGAGGGVSDVAITAREGMQVRDQAKAEDLISRGLSMPEETTAYKLAVEMQNAQTMGAELGSAELGNLQKAVQEDQRALSKEHKKAQDVADRALDSRGFTRQYSEQGVVAQNRAAQEALDNGQITEEEYIARTIKGSEESEEIYESAFTNLRDKFMPSLGEDATEEAVEEAAQEADTEARRGAAAILRVMTGEATAEDSLSFSRANPVLREELERQTGRVLPDSNADTAAMIREINANNRIRTGIRQTEYQEASEHDRAVGAGVQYIRNYVGGGNVSDEAVETFRSIAKGISTADMQLAAVNFRQQYSQGLGAENEDTFRAEPVGGPTVLTEEQQYQAFVAGLNTGKKDVGRKLEQMAKAKDEAKKGKTDSRKKGADTSNLTEEEKTTKRNEISQINKLAKALKATVVFENAESIREAVGSKVKDASVVNGWMAGGVIHINIDSKSAFIDTFSHELTHRFENYSPKEYKALQDFIIKSRFNNDRSAWQREIDQRIREYGSNNVTLTEADAIHEIIADMAVSFLNDEQVVRDIFAFDDSLAGKVRSTMLEIIDQMVEAIKSITGIRGAKELGLTEEQLNEARSLWLAAAEESRKNADLEIESGEQFELKPYSQKQIASWKNSDKIIVYENREQLLAFVDESLKGEDNTLKRMYLGIIPDSVADHIERATGEDVRGYNVTLSNYEIRKIFEDHGKESKESPRGQRAITRDDIADIIEIVTSADTIQPSGIYNGRPMIRFEKVINGREKVVTYKSSKRHSLIVQTMYSGIKKSLATPTDEQASVNTSETSSSTAPIENISQSSDSGKNNRKYSLSTRDADYLAAVERGDMETAQQMVDEAAERAGYTSTSDYQGTSAFNGEAPGPMYYESKEERKEAWDNDEYDDNQTLGDYADNGVDLMNLDFFLNDSRAIRNRFMQESVNNLRATVRTGKKTITMYRSVPANIAEDSFRNGDWITPSRSYAIDNAEVHGWGDAGQYRIIEQEVSIDDIWWDGNDINEWGYNDGTEYVYKNTVNNRKLPAVTYDDEGNVIPLSQRFDESNPDVRFSMSTDSKGRELSKGQQEFFKDSKVVDENGNLKVMYHGTENAGFTVFDPEYGLSSPRFFFTDNLEVAKGYSGTHDLINLDTYASLNDVNAFIREIGEDESYRAVRDGDEYIITEDGDEIIRSDDLNTLARELDEYLGWGGTSGNYEVYLNVTNPLIVDAKGKPWDAIEYDGDEVTTNWLAEHAAEEGYDGLIVKNVLDSALYNSTREIVPATDVVVFDSNQIKSVSNENPTVDPDIRFSIAPSLLSELKNIEENGVDDSGDIYVGTTSDFLLSGLGVREKEIYISQWTAKLVMTKPEDATPEERRQHVHGLGAEGLVDVLRESEEPILAFINSPSRRGTEEENDRADSVVLVTSRKDYKRRQIVVIDGIDSLANIGQGHRLKATKTINAFGQRSLDKMIQKAMENDRLLYINYEKISPETGGSVVQSNGARSETYFKDNIQKFWDNVNRLHGAYASANQDYNYMTAINNNDLVTAQRMVDEAAEKAMPNSKIRTRDGKLRKVYHGTYSDDFYVFDPSTVGSASGDTGFFGRGFYFAYSKGEAEMYGPNVKEVYANIENPFDFQKELDTYNGESTFDYNASRAVFVLNFAEKFPELAKGQNITAWSKEDDHAVELSFAQFAKEYKDVLENTKFEVNEYDGPYGKEWRTVADRETKSFTDPDGKTYSWPEYNYEKVSLDEKTANDKLVHAYYYLAQVKYAGITLPSPPSVIMDVDFSGELQKRGYDGIIQSEEGDEAVAFESSQIKLADPVTYDDNGEIIPLSKRFDDSTPDIRFSLATESSLHRQDLEKQVERLKRDKRLTKGLEPKANQVAQFVRKMQEDYSSDYSLNESVRAITGIYKMIKEGDHFAEIYGAVQDLARSIADSSFVMRDVEGNEEAVEMRGYFKGHQGGRLTLHVPKSMYAEFDHVGGINQFRRDYADVVRLSPTQGVDIDEAMTEIVDFFGEQWDYYYSNKGNYIDAMIDAIRLAGSEDAKKGTTEKVYKSDNRDPWQEAMQDPTEWDDLGVLSEIREDEVNMIIDDIFEAVEGSIDPDLSFADRKKMEKERALQKQRKHLMDSKKEAMRILRETKNEEIREAKKEGRAKAAEIRANERERARRLLDLRREREQQKRTAMQTRASKRSEIRRVEAIANRLAKKLLTPSDANHVPERYRKAIAEMLASLDFESTRTDQWEERYGRPSKRVANFRKLREEYDRILKDPQLQEFVEPDDQIYEWIRYLEEMDGMRLADMEAEQVRAVRQVVQVLEHHVNYANRMLTEGLKETRSEMAAELHWDIAAAKTGKGKDLAIQKFIKGEATPVHFFDRLGLKTFKDLYEKLTEAQDQHIRNLAEAMQVTQGIADTYGKKNIKAWSENTRTFTVSNGTEIELTDAQLMSLYALNKRDQARGHLLGAGVVVAPLKVKRTLKGRVKEGEKERLEQTFTRLTYKDVTDLLSNLSDEQIKAAETMLSFLKTTSRWGNETSMKLYGYQKFTEENYFPIQSAREYLNNSSLEESQDGKMKNAGFTKSTQTGASNPVVLDDFFDVTTSHINQMSQYNTFVPILEDMDRVYHHVEKDNKGLALWSVKGDLRDKYGIAAANYIEKLMRDVNSNMKTEVSDLQAMDQLVRNWKAAKIGLSFRVLFQQPTAVVRAMQYIDPKYFVGTPGGKAALSAVIPETVFGRDFMPKEIRAARDRMYEIVPLAMWKHWGYSQTDIHRSMRDTMMGNEGILDKVFFDMYGKADDFGWSSIFMAVERETRKEHPELEYDSPEYREHVNKRFREIADRTQVVDSVLHRSEIMREQNILSKTMTAFMAEPTTTINTIMTGFNQARVDWQNGNKATASKMAARTASVFFMNAVAVSLASSLSSAIRESWTGDDDDDEERNWIEEKLLALGIEEGSLLYDWLGTYFEKDFTGNINPLNMLPITKDIISMMEGYDMPNPTLALPESILKNAQNLQKWMADPEGQRYTGGYYIERSIEAVAELFGIPASNIRKEVDAFTNMYFRAIGEKDYGDYLEDRWALNDDYKGNKNTFIDHYINAVTTGHDQSAEDIYRKLKENGITDDDISDRAWNKVDPEFKQHVLDGVDTSKTEEKLKKMGITEDEIEDKKVSWFQSELTKAVKEQDGARVEDLSKTLKDTYGEGDYDVEKKIKSAAMSEAWDYIDEGDYDSADDYIYYVTKYTDFDEDDVAEAVSSHYMSDYYEAMDAGDTEQARKLRSTMNRYGVTDDVIYEKEAGHYKDYYRQKAYMALKSGDRDKAYQIAVAYTTKYPGTYKTGAQGMIYGLDNLADSTKEKYEGSSKYDKWQIPT